MKFNATQIAAILEGKVEGNPNAEVWNVAKIEEGAPGMISFLANPKYTHFIYETQSSIVIVNDDFEATAPIQATLIRVPDAYASFAKLLSFYDQMMQNKQGVSSLAFVSSTPAFWRASTSFRVFWKWTLSSPVPWVILSITEPS